MKSPATMLIVATLVFITAAAPLFAAELISYQGRLTSGGLPVADSTYSVTFGLYRDSTGGAPLWQETAPVPTDDGLFTHLLGSVTSLPGTLFVNEGRLFLNVALDGASLAPRTRLVATPTSAAAHQLRLVDNAGAVRGRTEAEDGGVLRLFNDAGAPSIVLHGGQVSDSTVILPDSAINADEIIDEPGIANQIESGNVPLSTGLMTDLAVIEIELPRDGFIVLYGKCYVSLSGTTGPNGAQIQIDADSGGAAIFPYYTHAGLSGFVNTGENYFPVFVTRTYYREAGIYEFRLEGKATHALPAVAETWDHILTAMYFPTAYGWVYSSSKSSEGNPTAIPIEQNSPGRPGVIYKLDLRYEKDSRTDGN